MRGGKKEFRLLIHTELLCYCLEQRKVHSLSNITFKELSLENKFPDYSNSKHTNAWLVNVSESRSRSIW